MGLRSQTLSHLFTLKQLSVGLIQNDQLPPCSSRLSFPAEFCSKTTKASCGELSLVKATESSNYFFVLEEETTAKGNKGYKIKRSTSAEHSIASHSIPQTGGSRLFALSLLSILAQVDNDDVDNWGDLAGIDYKGLLDYEDALALEKVLKGEWEVEKADYDTDAGHINEPAPVILATQTVTDNSDISQSSGIDMTRGVSEMSSFSFTSGFSLSVGACFSVGVPFVGDGKISTKATVSTDFTYGQTKSTTITVGQRVHVKPPPRSTVKATGTVKFSTSDVPCTLHLRSKVNNTVTTHPNMVYKGLTYWDFAVEYGSA